MNTMTRTIIVVAVLAVAALAFVAKQRKQASPPATTEAVAGASVLAHSAKLPKLLDLGAGKCIPCKMMKPILDDLKANYADRFITEFIDVWENPDAGRQYGIEVIPTQIFYDAEGKELFRHVGFYGKEDILGKWKELGVPTAGQDNDGTQNTTTESNYEP
jgi:thioredoxin 1